jgi:hypothetical protein
MDADTPGTPDTSDTPDTPDNPSTRDPIEALLDEQVKERFLDGSISRAELLRYGDDPRIEPGKLLVRVHVKTPAESGDDPMDDWEHAHQTATRQLHDELTRKVPEVTALEFVMETAGGRYQTARIGMLASHSLSDMEERARTGGGTLTPVMARLGPADLETLDTLITAGIATTRADAVRWALARIRERPAYERLRERAHELEELKSQF